MELALKKFDARDFADYYRLVSDDRVMAMITERAIPAEEARRDYEALLSANELHPEFGQFRVMDAQQNAFVGLAKLAVSSKHAESAELGYMILPEYWGQGIASQIARLLIARAKAQPALRSLFAIIDPANAPSRKILVNNGFVSKEFKDFDGLPGEVLEQRWQAMAGLRHNRSGELEVFVRVIELGGFSAAARACGMTPSTASKLVTRLERRLGTRLVNRSTRQLQLTPEGCAF